MRGIRRALPLGAVAAALWLVPPAQAVIPASLYSPGTVGQQGSGCVTLTPHAGHSFVYCDDDTPSNGNAPGPGGVIPNTTGARAVTVPAEYGGADGYTGLPAKASDAASMPGADANGNIALDVDVSLPTSPPPPGGYPLIFMMHGCCGGSRRSWEDITFDADREKWHYNNAWFASRGYAVVTYTARGFVNNQERGSTGETQLDSRRFEINDYQSLACQVLAQASDFDDVTPQSEPVTINPARIVVTGGSYGGGFSWLAITDPAWTCTPETGTTQPMRLAAGAPKYGWTDLAYTLVPNGLHSQAPGDLPAFDGCDTGPRMVDGSVCPGTPTPVGTPKSSIIAALYGTGNAQAIDHATFPASIHEAFACLNGPYPPESNPACSNTINAILPEFLRDRSAYYQSAFFASIANPASWVPIFNAATFTDPLFPAYENRRMHNRILAEAPPGYPLKTYFGDYQHFVQNKAKEWADICDDPVNPNDGRHRCTFADHSAPGGVNADPPTLVPGGRGITTRLNRFIDFYAQPGGGYTTFVPSDTTPDVTASLQVCPQNAGPGQPADEPGPRFGPAATFEALTTGVFELDMPGTQQTTSEAEPNPHAVNSDPFNNTVRNGNGCNVETSSAGPGVASYTSTPLDSQRTMIGSAIARIDFGLSGPATGLQLNSRMYDVFPDGSAVLVDRGVRRVTAAEAAAGQLAYELHGNGWRFPAGHRIRIEVAQDYEPFVRNSDFPSSTSISRVRLEVPTVEGDARGGGGSTDADADGVNDQADNCPDVANPSQQDSDGDGSGDACDPAASRAAPDCEATVLSGTGKRDKLSGGDAPERLFGRRGRDRLSGGGGDDCIAGGGGPDRLKGEAGRDLLQGGSGADRLLARDGEADRVRCGKGEDAAKVDGSDTTKNCERVRTP